MSSLLVIGRSLCTHGVVGGRQVCSAVIGGSLVSAHSPMIGWKQVCSAVIGGSLVFPSPLLPVIGERQECSAVIGRGSVPWAVTGGKHGHAGGSAAGRGTQAAPSSRQGTWQGVLLRERSPGTN